MDTTSVADLLHEASETHHRVYRSTDGTDDDWASWYADWLIGHSELPALLGTEPVRSELVYVLVLLDKEYSQRQITEVCLNRSRPKPMGRAADDTILTDRTGGGTASACRDRRARRARVGTAAQS